MDKPADAFDESALPLLYGSANDGAIKHQRLYLRLMRVQLGALLLAAAFGAIPWTLPKLDLAGTIAAVAFGAALVCELWVLKDRPEWVWYECRAAAESAKTLAWRYMAGAHPFGLEEMSDENADKRFLGRLGKIVREVKKSALTFLPGTAPKQITPEMRRIRAMTLPERQELYLRDRINDQISWYLGKADWNNRRRSMWSRAIMAGMFAGLAAGVLKAVGVFSIDLLGLMAAFAASIAAWNQLKQHSNLSTAYSLAAMELTLIADSAAGVTDEAQWSSFVADAEEAISREHTMWVASHS